MPIILKSNQMYYKDPDAGDYKEINVLAEEATATKVAEINTAGTTAKNTAIAAIQEKANEVTSQLASAGELEGMLAGAFSSSTNYTAGQYVIQSVTIGGNTTNKLFRFTADHAAGEWIGTDAVEIKLGDDVTGLKSALNNCVKMDGIKQVTIDNCDFTDVEQSNNLCNPEDILWDKGIDNSGDIVDTLNYILTGLIDITDTHAWFGRNGSLMVATRLILYKSDGTFKRVQNAQSGYDVTGWDQLRAWMPYSANTDTFFVALNDSDSVAPAIDAFYKTVTIAKQYIPPTDGINPFFGLKGVAFGTSLTARAYEDHKYETDTYGYLTYLRQLSGMTIDNQGVGGATILANSGNSIYNAIMEYTGYADKAICVLEGFVNDWYTDAANTLGTYTDTLTTTVCGRLRNAINYIMSQNQYITIFAVFDHYGKVSGNRDFSSTAVVNGFTPYQYYQELIKTCESLGVICIYDYISGIGENAPQYLADYIHLNDLGAKQSGRTIWQQLRQYYPKITL